MFWRFFSMVVCIIRKIVFILRCLILPRQKLKTPIEPSQQARFNFLRKKRKFVSNNLVNTHFRIIFAVS